MSWFSGRSKENDLYCNHPVWTKHLGENKQAALAGLLAIPLGRMHGFVVFAAITTEGDEVIVAFPLVSFEANGMGEVRVSGFSLQRKMTRLIDDETVAKMGHPNFDVGHPAQYAVASPEATKITADLINRFPDRFLFGTDEVVPTSQQSYLKAFYQYGPL